MNATVGDRIVVRGNRVGEPDRYGVITAVRNPDGSPPYAVKWDDGREALVFPSADATIKPPSEQRS